jgi:hypothetical protein
MKTTIAVNNRRICPERCVMRQKCFRKHFLDSYIKKNKTVVSTFSVLFTLNNGAIALKDAWSCLPIIPPISPSL